MGTGLVFGKETGTYMLCENVGDLLSTMYRVIVKKDNLRERVSKATEEAVADSLKNVKLEGDSFRQEELYSTAMLIASAAEENGFAMGFKFAFHLLMECMTGG